MKSITTKPNDVRCYDNVNQRHNVQDFITVKSNLEAVTELIDNQELPCPYTLRYSGAWDIRVINITQENNPNLEFIEKVTSDHVTSIIQIQVLNNNVPVTGAHVYYMINDYKNQEYLRTNNEGFVNIPVVNANYSSSDRHYENGDNTLVVWANNIPMIIDGETIINHDTYYAQTSIFKVIRRGFMSVSNSSKGHIVTVRNLDDNDTAPGILVKGAFKWYLNDVIQKVTAQGITDDTGKVTLDLSYKGSMFVRDMGTPIWYDFEASNEKYTIPNVRLEGD